MPFPGVYPDDNKIIPHSPRRRFGFASPSGIITDKVIELESMKNMSIDQIVELYKDGYTIDALPETPATSERQRKYGFMDIKALPFEHTPPEAYERERKYGFMDDTSLQNPREEREKKYGFAEDTGLPFEHEPPSTYERQRKYGFMDVVPPGVVERWEREKKYGFTGQGSQVVIGSDVLLLGTVVILAYLYLKKK